MPTATLLPTSLPIWPPTTSHYAISDGTWLLVEVDENGPTAVMQAYVDQVADVTNTELVPMPMDYVLRPTVILPANAAGFATSLDVLHRFDAGTTAADALAQAGFEVSP